MLQALSELEDHYSFGPLTGAQWLAPVMEMMVAGALGPDEMPINLNAPLGTSGQDLTVVGTLCPCAQKVALRTPMSRMGHHVDVSLAC